MKLSTSGNRSEAGSDPDSMSRDPVTQFHTFITFCCSYSLVSAVYFCRFCDIDLHTLLCILYNIINVFVLSELIFYFCCFLYKNVDAISYLNISVCLCWQLVTESILFLAVLTSVRE